MKPFVSFLCCLFILLSTVFAQPDSSVYLLDKLASQTITASERKQLRQLAFDFQNRGQKLDENNHDYHGSLLLVNKAIKIFEILNDTLNDANNRKFKGYLLARLGRFKEGKQEIHRSLHLFQSKGAAWGTAVSQFNLSRIYELENKFDSALFFCNLAMQYWKIKEDTGRMFLNQNMLINLLTKTKKLSRAKTLQFESKKMSVFPGQHWQGLIDFYDVSEKLFRSLKDFKIAKYYHALYKSKIAALKQEGIIAISYFKS